MGAEEYFINGLTWQGHDFLEAARSSDIWERAKKQFADKMVGALFDLLKGVLLAIIKTELGPGSSSGG